MASLLIVMLSIIEQGNLLPSSMVLDQFQVSSAMTISLLVTW